MNLSRRYFFVLLAGAAAASAAPMQFADASEIAASQWIELPDIVTKKAHPKLYETIRGVLEARVGRKRQVFATTTCPLDKAWRPNALDDKTLYGMIVAPSERDLVQATEQQAAPSGNADYQYSPFGHGIDGERLSVRTVVLGNRATGKILHGKKYLIEYPDGKKHETYSLKTIEAMQAIDLQDAA